MVLVCLFKKQNLINYVWSYFRTVSQSKSSSFQNFIPELTAIFGLGPPLVEVLASRKTNRYLAPVASKHLRDTPLTLLPGCILILP